MEIINLNKSNLSSLNKENFSLCIGFFDGVHLGHQSLINAAKKYPYPIYVLSFTGNFKTEKSILTDEEKSIVVENLGCSKLLLMKLDDELINTSAFDFVEKYLKVISPKVIVCGEDFRFGYKNQGNPAYLSKFFDVEVVPLLYVENVKVSSSLIRKLLENGNIELANKFLGYNYFIVGEIVKGLGNGKKFGFKTANIQLNKNLVNLKNGVYFVSVSFKDKNYHGICNIGVHPTISKLDLPIVEVHVFDIDDLSINTKILIKFHKFFRDEIKFDSVDELKKQVFSDIEKAKLFFKDK